MGKFIKDNHTFNRDVKISSSSKLYLDGGGDSYITEVIPDGIDIVVGGELQLRINESGGGASDSITTGGVLHQQQDLKLTATKKLYFDSGSDTYIHESGADVLDFQVGDINMLKMTEDGASTTLATRGRFRLLNHDGSTYDDSSSSAVQTKAQIDSAISAAGGGGSTTLKHWMDWYNYGANLASQNTFYSEKHNDEFGVSSTINTDLTSSGYSTTTLNNAWRMIRYSRRVPYSGTITKFMVHLEASGAAADSDVEVALWWADALADDTEHASTTNFTCDHLATLTFDFSSASRFMTKQTTSFNATSISEGDWLFITLRKTTSGDGSSFHCHSTVLWDGA